MGEKTVKAPVGLAWVSETRIVEGEKPSMTRKGLAALCHISLPQARPQAMVVFGV
jgi:hypothetical protein